MKPTETCHLCCGKIGFRGSLGSDEIDGVYTGVFYVCSSCAKDIAKKYLDLVD